ncbi:MAG: hypothetical protein WCY53_03310 [Sphaerochaetaceae bacterium]
MMLALIFLFIILYLFFRREKKSNTDINSPLEIIKKRYAAGEISRTEFFEMKDQLSK